MTKNNSVLYSQNLFMYFDDEIEKSFIAHTYEMTNAQSDYILDINDGHRGVYKILYLNHACLIYF